MATSKRTTSTEPGDVAEPVQTPAEAPADDTQSEGSTEPADGVVEGDLNIVQPLQGLDGMPLPLGALPTEMVQDPHSGAIVSVPVDENEKDVTRDDR